MNTQLLTNNRRGYIMILMGLSLFMLISFFSVVVDLGHIFVTKAELQNASDSAALASISDLPRGELLAKTTALDFGQSHYVAGQMIAIADSDVQFGRYDFSKKELVLGDMPYNAVEVDARRTNGSGSGALPLFFAPLFGKNFSNVQAKSKAVLDNHVVGVHGKNRLIPYSVHLSVVDQDGDGKFDIGGTVDIFPQNSAPGNFGFLDLDGGSNGTPELRYYIENGYDQDFIIPPGGYLQVSGTPGIGGNSILTSFQIILNTVVFLPVHDYVVEQGSNSLYHIISILAVKIKEVKFTGSQNDRYIETEIISYSSSVLVIDPKAGENNSLAKPRLIV